jgi:tetratricopeptide (TPR) repeat protein
MKAVRSRARSLELLVLAVLIAVASIPTSSAVAANSEQRFEQASLALKDHKTEEGLKLLRALAADPKADRDFRLKSFWKVVELQSASKDFEAAIATTNEMMAAFPDDNDLALQVYSTQANLWWTAHKPDQAVEACHQVVAHAGDDKEEAIAARKRAASFLQQSRNYSQLCDEANLLLKLLDDDARAADALWYLADATWQMGRYDECLDKTRRIVDEFPRAAVWQNRTAHARVLDCLRKLGKTREVCASCEEWERKDPDARYRQKWCFTAAETYAAGKDAAAALAAYRRVISGHCGDNVSELWLDAQGKIVDLLTANNDLKAALQEAHILFDASHAGAALTQITQRVAGLFDKLDNDSTRGNRFIAFQFYGPDGADGKPGTEDDLANPLDEIGYPADRERIKTLAKAFAGLGTDAAASHHRGMICLFAGRPKDALFYFMDAVRRSSSDKYPDYATSLVVNGLRAVRGHSIGLDDAVRYLINGPGGDGGKDALADPFKPYAGLAPAAPFASVPLPPKDVELLSKLQASLMTSAADATWPADVRRKAFAALARLNESLDAWPKTADWYRGLLAADADPKMRPTIFSGALAAVRGNVLHLGNVRAFVASLDSAGKPETHFRTSIHSLEQLQKGGATAPHVKPRVAKPKKPKGRGRA